MTQQLTLAELMSVIQELNQKVANLEDHLKKSTSCPEVRRIWTPRDEVMEFLNYGETQISAITKKYTITTSDIGKRRFYSNASLLDLLDKNKK